MKLLQRLLGKIHCRCSYSTRRKKYDNNMEYPCEIRGRESEIDSDTVMLNKKASDSPLRDSPSVEQHAYNCRDFPQKV